MSSGRTSGIATAGSTTIPNSARKLVHAIKEIVTGSNDEDIYIMLKDCNMDLDQTVQRLLNEDAFHEVKRKRDKKKEASSKDNMVARGRSSNAGFSSRGGRGSGQLDRNAGKGNSLSKLSSNEMIGGNGKSYMAKENGMHSSGRMVPVSVDSAPRSSPPEISSVPETIGSSFLRQTSGTSLVQNVSSPRLAWVAAGSGNATMAEVLKANGPQLPTVPTIDSLHAATSPVPKISMEQSPVSTGVSPISSGMYSSLSDPVLQRSLDLHISGSPGAIKKAVGIVGNQRPVGERPSIVYSSDAFPSSASMQAQSPVGPTSVASPTGHNDGLHSERTSLSMSLSGTRPQTNIVSDSLPDISSSVVEQPLEYGVSAVPDSSPSRTGIISHQFGNRQLYQPQHPPVGSQKPGGSSLEWKPKSLGQVSTGATSTLRTSSASDATDNLNSPPPSELVENSVLSSTSSKFQGLNVQDNQPVILPNHLQRPEVDHVHLSFGSFGAGFGASFSTDFTTKESSESPLKESSVAAEAAPEMFSSAATSPTIPLNQSYIQHQVAPVQVDNSSAINGIGAISFSGPVTSQSEVSSPGAIIQQGPPYPYLPTVPSYPGYGLMPQVPGGQLSFDSPDSLAADVPRLSGLVQPYPDPLTSFYTPAFRAISDADSRHPSGLSVSSKVIGKYNGSMALVTGQSFSSQETGSSLAVSHAAPASQTSPTSSVQPVATMPQQPVPLQAYAAHPATIPLGHYPNVFGYQYVPPSYPYLHTPYQHNFAGSGGYPQPPAGSNYPPGNSFPLGTGLAVKYPLTQYKSGSAALNTPHAGSSAGFGAYATAPSGYAGNQNVAIGTASGYEEVTGPQYKESNLYIPSQQGEGSTIWVPTQLSRDIAAAGMQANSFYNLPGQGHHTPYAHAQQQHAHALPASTYPNLYHASQSTPTPTAHQLLQQQTMGTGTQGGAYQQARLQQNWNNNY